MWAKNNCNSLRQDPRIVSNSLDPFRTVCSRSGVGEALVGDCWGERVFSNEHLEGLENVCVCVCVTKSKPNKREGEMKQVRCPTSSIYLKFGACIQVSCHFPGQFCHLSFSRARTQLIWANAHCISEVLHLALALKTNLPPPALSALSGSGRGPRWFSRGSPTLTPAVLWEPSP